MGLIREPLDVDFVVDTRPLTKAEEKTISDFIRADKEKRKLKALRAKTSTKRKAKQLSREMAPTANA
ncbi:MAG: hypothetical protein LCH37_13495 [Bacteroidetes bacterium]|nr:hypothetical protein [Bacteroidota bacterium]